MCTLSAVHQALLRQQPPRFDAKLIEPPTYIRTLITEDDSAPTAAAKRRILFVYKQGDATQIKSPLAPPTITASRPKRQSGDKYEVTGTPLEDDCQIDTIDDSLIKLELEGKRLWSAEEAAYLPIPLDVAHNVLNTVNAMPCSQGSVWTLCSSPDAAAATAEADVLAMMWRYSECWQIRGLVRFTGMQHYRQIDLAQLRAQHVGYLRGAVTSATPLQTHIEARFDIQPSLEMRLAWDVSSTANTSALSSYRKADIMVSQTVRIGSGGDSSSTVAAEDYWRQLLRLNYIKEQIVAYREQESRSQLVYASGSELSMTAIRDRVQRILSDVVPLPPSKDEVRGTVELEPVLKRSVKRELVDITDQLWMLLKLCASYDDLKAAFGHILQCAAKCNVVNMPTSDNHLAVLIREISEQRLAVPCLSGAEPLELLLEIGLEKALKDYEHIFAESQLCTAKDFQAAALQIQPASAVSAEGAASTRQTMLLRNQRVASDDETSGGRSGPQNSAFDRLACERKLGRLSHVHLLMEHLLMLQINLNWHQMHDYVMSELRRPAKPFSVYQTQLCDKRDIPIVCSKVAGKVEGMEPDILKIQMKSQNKFSTIENTFVYSTASLFPGNVFPQTQMDEKTIESPSYCGVHYLQLGTFKG